MQESVVMTIEKRGANESAHRALSNCGQIFRYAVATGKAERDPSGDLKGALEPVNKKHFSALTEPKDVGKLLHIIDGYQGSLIVRTALCSVNSILKLTYNKAITSTILSLIKVSINHFNQFFPSADHLTFI